MSRIWNEEMHDPEFMIGFGERHRSEDICLGDDVTPEQLNFRVAEQLKDDSMGRNKRKHDRERITPPNMRLVRAGSLKDGDEYFVLSKYKGKEFLEPRSVIKSEYRQGGEDGRCLLVVDDDASFTYIREGDQVLILKEPVESIGVNTETFSDQPVVMFD